VKFKLRTEMHHWLCSASLVLLILAASKWKRLVQLREMLS
jgi:hypothetical protein